MCVCVHMYFFTYKNIDHRIDTTRHRKQILATTLKREEKRVPYLSQMRAFGPFLEGDVVVVVRIAGVEERPDAVLESDEGSADGEQLMARHGPWGRKRGRPALVYARGSKGT